MRGKFALETGMFSWGPFQPSGPLEEAPLRASAVGWVRFLPPARGGGSGLGVSTRHPAIQVAAMLRCVLRVPVA